MQHQRQIILSALKNKMTVFGTGLLQKLVPVRVEAMQKVAE